MKLFLVYFVMDNKVQHLNYKNTHTKHFNKSTNIGKYYIEKNKTEYLIYCEENIHENPRYGNYPFSSLPKELQDFIHLSEVK